MFEPVSASFWRQSQETEFCRPETTGSKRPFEFFDRQQRLARLRKTPRYGVKIVETGKVRRVEDWVVELIGFDPRPHSVMGLDIH